MKNKIAKISLIVVIIMTLSSVIVVNQVNGTTINPDDFTPVIQDGDPGEAIDIARKIVGVINVVGTIILVVVIMALGLKYITGSLEQRAEYQKTMIPILIGAILLFGVSWILKIIIQIIPTID